jgi:predicted dehydrogenase
MGIAVNQLVEVAGRRQAGDRTQPPPRLGFLGLGWIGQQRMQALRESGSATIAALVDPSERAREQASELAPEAEALPDFSALLDQPLDGVVIATPSAMHGDQVRAALERGLPVFCQKPLARDAAETRSLVDAARAADRRLGVDLSYRSTQAMRAIAELVAKRALGEIYALDLAFHNAYGPDKPWFYDARQSGGGCLMDLGVHMIDLALWTLGFPKVIDVQSRLFSAGQRLRGGGRDHGRDRGVEDYALAELSLSTGAVVRIASSWKLHAGRDCAIHASFYGTEAGATFRNVGGSFYDFTAESLHGTSRMLLAAPPDPWGGRAAIEWAQSLARDPGWCDDALRFVEVAETLDRIYEVAR